MSIVEKVAYLKGLMNGMKFDAESDTGKVISSIVDILDEIAASLSDARDDIDTINDYVDELDYDLGDLESYVYGEDECDCCHHADDDDFDEDEDDDEDEDEDDEDEDEDDSVYVEIECPNCGDKVYFDESLEADEIICPGCNGTIKLK